MRMDIASGRKQLIALACIVLCLCNQLAAGTAEVAENLNFRSPIDNVPQLGLEHLHPTNAGRRLLQQPEVYTGGRSFKHGVASGDPLEDGVIIWSRVTPDDPTAGGKSIEVLYEVALDPSFTRIAQKGVIYTSAAVDFTLKVDVSNLLPATTYYYQFLSANQGSGTGRTKTLPSQGADVSKFKIAVFSCSNLPQGYFHGYNHAANRNDLDLALHVGDYLYEYANKEYGDGSVFNPARIPLPDKEMVSLEDYRLRHATYRADKDLQAATRNVPWILVWDDHEITNDAWFGGAENHDPDQGEGPWYTRRATAVRAYFEWIPIRPVRMDSKDRIYRSFSVGNLAEIIMLDTRLIGRSEQANATDWKTIYDRSRSILGADQEEFVKKTLSASKENNLKWRVLGNQVPIAPRWLGSFQAPNTVIGSVDKWEGYPESRYRILEHLWTNDINNTVAVTGDVHSAWVMDNPLMPYNSWGRTYNQTTGAGSLMVECVGTAVTSPPAYRANGTMSRIVEQRYLDANPHHKYVNLQDNGYFTLELTQEKIKCEYVFTSDITKPTYTATVGPAFESASNANVIKRV
jgi:alkaline phosphatase D